MPADVFRGLPRPMPLKIDAPFRERKYGRPCVFPGCSFVSIGRDDTETEYDLEQHILTLHMRDSRANQLMANRGLLDHVFPTPGTAHVPPMLIPRVPQPPTYPTPPAVEYLKRPPPRQVA